LLQGEEAIDLALGNRHTFDEELLVTQIANRERPSIERYRIELGRKKIGRRIFRRWL